ncbi:hypothetical protein BOX15_Mlig024211g1 [Macrostomum lignano]|uniref:Uncharacterized protein n=1 Tax=Macrostomum lignano TaxID=282301 RepID=A0A267H9S7_9PLAT|nr:hypothetical protein BOX15_Mlig024211g1 [Macrostomum lignano]
MDKDCEIDSDSSESDTSSNCGPTKSGHSALACLSNTEDSAKSHRHANEQRKLAAFAAATANISESVENVGEADYHIVELQTPTELHSMSLASATVPLLQTPTQAHSPMLSASATAVPSLQTPTQAHSPMLSASATAVPSLQTPTQAHSPMLSASATTVPSLQTPTQAHSTHAQPLTSAQGESIIRLLQQVKSVLVDVRENTRPAVVNEDMVKLFFADCL